MTKNEISRLTDGFRDAILALQEFVDDVEARYTTDASSYALRKEWPDLVVTYEHAVAALDAISLFRE
jgi:hypothetical protein